MKCKKKQKTKKNETKEQPEKTRFGFSLCSEHFNPSNQKQKHVQGKQRESIILSAPCLMQKS